jgi:hypothetical protein
MTATTRKNTPRLRDGVMKRGTTWSYVIRRRCSSRWRWCLSLAGVFRKGRR